MKHGRSFAELAVAVAAMLLVAACGKGPGEPPEPLPTWSPPTWMHGSWAGIGATGDGTAVTGTVEVSAHNLDASFEVGGVEHPLDLQLAERGGATIQHDSGVSDEDQRYYGIVIIPQAGGTVNLFLCSEEDSTTMVCDWSERTPPAMEETRLATVVLKKQPG